MRIMAASILAAKQCLAWRLDRAGFIAYLIDSALVIIKEPFSLELPAVISEAYELRNRGGGGINFLVIGRAHSF